MLLTASTKPKAIINWDAIFQPRGGSPRQTLATMFSFAELYTYQWVGIESLPASMQSKVRTAFATVYFPQVVNFYLSKDLTQLIDSLKLGVISQQIFFSTLLNNYFPFLKKVEGIDPLELIKNAWLNPRIQPLTSHEQRRFAQALQDFETIILIANTNTPDIAAFIQNLLLNPDFASQLALAPDVLKQLETFQRQGSVPQTEELLNLLWDLGHNVKILTSPQTGEWKVQTGTLATKTGSPGFVSKLFQIMSGPILVLSEAPADIKQANKAHSEPGSQVTAMTSGQYFNDISPIRHYAMNAYDNWPVLAIFILAIALLMWIF